MRFSKIGYEKGGGARNAEAATVFSLAHICTTRERERATVCILHDAGAIALGIGVSLVDELLDLHHLVQSLRPLSTLICREFNAWESPLLAWPPLHYSAFLLLILLSPQYLFVATSIFFQWCRRTNMCCWFREPPEAYKRRSCCCCFSCCWVL